MISKTNLLQQIAPVVVIAPEDNDGTAITSSIIDRKGYGTAYLNLNWAASSGTPTTAKADIKVYSNTASSSSSPTPVLLATLETALDIKAAGTKSWALDLGAANRYVYAVVDVTYVDGTTPKNILSGILILGDKNVEPPVATTVYGR